MTSISPATRYNEYRYRESQKILTKRDRKYDSNIKKNTLRIQAKTTLQNDNSKCIDPPAEKNVLLNSWNNETNEIEKFHNLEDKDIHKSDNFKYNGKLTTNSPHTFCKKDSKEFERSQKLENDITRNSTTDLNNNNDESISNDVRKSVLHRISEISLNEDSECKSESKNHTSCQQSPSKQAWEEMEVDQSENGFDNLHLSEHSINETDDLIGGYIDERNQSECSIDSTRDLIGGNSDDEFDTDIEDDFPGDFQYSLL